MGNEPSVNKKVAVISEEERKRTTYLRKIKDYIEAGKSEELVQLLLSEEKEFKKKYDEFQIEFEKLSNENTYAKIKEYIRELTPNFDEDIINRLVGKFKDSRYGLLEYKFDVGKYDFEMYIWNTRCELT